ncbi:MAG TPA: PQQ-dependent sugar dehydrogenase, partial [Longimicrobiales bacterium]|nr:PQQ-dependent sugar dehydrogenase [Longimicrobiales bacterium]
LELLTPGPIPADLRRPGAVAIAAGTEDLETFHLRARIRSTRDTAVVGRDVILVFGYRSPREFYYAHLSNDNTVMPHNGIFVVDHEDRRRIDDQGLEAPPEARLMGTRWHSVRLDRDAESGAIRVYQDDLREPLMTARDTTFRSGAVGFGSFDDTGTLQGLQLAEGPGPLDDPVPGPGAPELTVRLEPFAVVPPSDTTGGPRARINVLDHAGDGSGRLFVNDMRGVLHVIDDGRIAPYLDVAARFPDFVDEPGLGSGFGFFAFHPDFASNGRLYTVHTEAGAALQASPADASSGADVIQGVLVEWTASDPGAGSFDGTHRELLRLGFGATLHGVQQIGFDPLVRAGDEDFGLLYVAVGDGEVPGAQTPAPQLLTAPRGKILRIDPTGRDGLSGAYGIPPGNPFADAGEALGEIWALGLRNPHRFSWDPATGAMYIGHIGEARVDAVFPGRAGANYGWNLREGGFRYEKDTPMEVYPLTVADSSAAFTPPVARLDHDDLGALVGGFVYRGAGIPALQGRYVFGDLVSGALFEARAEELARGRPDTPIRRLGIQDEAGVDRSMAELAGRARAEIRFGMDAEGELYVLSKANGAIWKVVRPLTRR